MTERKRSFIASLPKMTVLLVFFPVAIVMEFMGIHGMPIFIVAALGILGTVTLIGKATEEMALYAGPLWGGLLNATFGNVTELIIALFALSKGPELYPIVLGSIVGSIIGNLLLVLGAAMVVGGVRHSIQKVSRTSASMNVSMLWVCLIAMSVPSFVAMAGYLNVAEFKEFATDKFLGEISIVASIILLSLYLLMLLFSFKTHKFLLMADKETHEKPEWSKMTAMILLFVATAIVAYLSEVFVGSIEYMKHHNTIQVSDMFIGVIIVAVVGNAAEGSVAIWVARQNKMELAFQIAMGSCLQVALMVAPVLVLASALMGDLMPLAFDPFMLMALGAATVVASSALTDGETNWLEGATFLAVYIFFALVFWFHP